MLQYERVRRIVAYLLRHEKEIEAWDKGQLVFDCAGKTVKVAKKEIESI